ncbi:hypothetical protein [Pseudanabaena sp. FACHB-2040]|uniref:hypothetical protein n=1 Tax=Pseudanabaena sp. FACHB-2040 TaxID=2692859 RepID=UPI001685A961|nr:hypothetical protein [Pseudanabaena sp. FACHB-2040]MBD2257770.1 hypothetical protein [Pseudanabaena sp. FACHB-2040]
MVKSPLARSRRTAPAASLQEQIQLALALADEGSLRSLLTDSLPAIARPHEIDQVRAEVGIPVPGANSRCVDGLIRFEQIRCVLAGSRPDLALPRLAEHPNYQHLTNCQSELVTLAQNIALSDAIALLSHAGFDAKQISQILHLPSQAWHKSWWFMADFEGSLTIPFQRLMRVRHFGDGTLTLQYKDFYAQERPPEFKGHLVHVPVVIRQPSEGFFAVLERINVTRQAFGTPQVILITEQISELEAEGLIRQNVSLFTAQDRLRIPETADCSRCQQSTCPLQGETHSPVVKCRAFITQK